MKGRNHWTIRVYLAKAIGDRRVWKRRIATRIGRRRPGIRSGSANWIELRQSVKGLVGNIFFRPISTQCTEIVVERPVFLRNKNYVVDVLQGSVEGRCNVCGTGNRAGQTTLRFTFRSRPPTEGESRVGSCRQSYRRSVGEL